MTTKLITKEFLFKPSDNFKSGVVNRTLDVWPAFLNNYGVWPNYGNGVENHILNFSWTPVKGGVYTFTATCDNSFSWSLANAWVQGPPEFFAGSPGGQFDGSLARGVSPGTPGGVFRRKFLWPGFVNTINQQNQVAFTQVLKGNSWQTIESVVPKTRLPDNTSQPRGVQLVGAPADFIANNNDKGSVRLRFAVRNDGGPAALAASITNSDGEVEWHTRQEIIDNSTGRWRQDSFPFEAEITVHAWGAGGGAGGSDGGTQGGSGAPGSYNTTTFRIERGDSLEICIGTGGRGGVGSQAGAPGGAGGNSRKNFNDNYYETLSGGKGGTAGRIPSSGGGGGGGGATVVIVNDTLKLVAFGGAGGGGAGNDGNGPTQIARRTATTTNNATGVSSIDFRGENGQTKSGDGGAGGGGGGGYPGGQGGAVHSGDTSAYPGQSGGNFPVNPYSSGANTTYYKAGFAGAGILSGTNGQDGRVVIEIRPVSLMTVKDSGEWKQISNAYTKVSGDWKEITEVYTKINGEWRPNEGVGIQEDFPLTPSTLYYGTDNRPYS